MIKRFSVSMLIVVSLAVPLAQVQAQSDVHPNWVRQYMSEFAPEFDMPFAMAVDASGNALITGSFSGPHNLPDIVTIKYDSAGNTLWTRRYNGPGDSWDIGRAVAIDPLGNVYVTGETHSAETDMDYVTIKYSSSGAQEWTVQYNNGPEANADRALANAVDASGNVFVTGTSSGLGTADDYATIMYNSLGEQQWVARYNGPGNTQDRAAGLAIDADGNVYVAGSSGEGSANRSDFVTVKYNSSGVQQWVGRYTNYWDYATAIAVDASANVYVTGHSYAFGTYYDYVTVKYSTDGVQKWARRWNGPGTSDDIPYALKVDPSGNVLVTGDAFFEIDHGSDYGTVKYSPSGVELWVARYDGPGSATDIAWDLAIDDAGDVYVTGGSRGTDFVDDFLTIKYSASGVEQWTIRHSDEGEVYNIATEIGLDGSGGVYVAGSGSRLGGRTATTVKYGRELPVTTGTDRTPRGYAFELAGPNPFGQRMVMRYSLGAREHTMLKVFNVRGQKVATLIDGVQDAGHRVAEWNAVGMPSGVYYVRLQAGDFVETKRVVLLK